MSDINKIIKEIGAALVKLEKGDSAGVQAMRSAITKARKAGIDDAIIAQAEAELRSYGE